VNKILAEHIPSTAMPFLDDIGVKGPRTTYNDEEILPGIRRYHFEHIQALDRVLADIERAGCTVSGAKSEWCKNGIQIVGYVCDSEGRHPQTSKVVKILEWPEPTNTKEVRGFLGVCVYYRIFVREFALVAKPLYDTLRKNITFSWGVKQQASMDALKDALTTAPALMPLDYAPEAGQIVIAVDASLTGWGAVLMQGVKGNKKKRHPVRYESGMWSPSEAAYDAGKRECRGVLRALQKFSKYIYGVYFVLEVDT